MLSGEQPTIFGDGKQSRDFTYIDNVVSANLLACRAEASKVAGKVINVATGRRTDLYQTFLILKKLIGYTGDVKYGPERAGDVKHSLADISRAEQFLGYKPKVDFEEGLSRTVEWYRSNDTKLQTAEPATRRFGVLRRPGGLSFSTSRRKFLKAGAAVAAAGALAVVGDGASSRPTGRKWSRSKFPSRVCPNRGTDSASLNSATCTTIDHFSVVPIAKAVDLVNGLQPDLMVVTGDFVTSPFSATSLAQPGCEGDRALRPTGGPDAGPLRHSRLPGKP